MKEYVSPSIEVIEISNNDVIQTSAIVRSGVQSSFAEVKGTEGFF